MSAADIRNKKNLFLNIAEGDETAFRSLFDENKERFYAVAFKMTRSAELAEEVIQEVFLILWDKRVLVSQASNPMGYLVKILHNVIYAHFRRILRERQELQKFMSGRNPVEQNPVEELLLEKENNELLDSIIGQLTPQQRLVYKLNKQEGLSREEIAKKLKISPNTVRNHLAASFEFIRDYIKKNASLLVWVLIYKYL